MKTEKGHNERNALGVLLLISVGIIIYLLLLQHPHSTTSTAVVVGINPMLSSYGNVYGPSPSGAFIPTVTIMLKNTGATSAIVDFNLTTSGSYAGGSPCVTKCETDTAVTINPAVCQAPVQNSCASTSQPYGALISVVGAQASPVEHGIAGFSEWHVYFTVSVDGVVQSSYSWSGTNAPAFYQDQQIGG